jgi:hypothetical protein
VDVPEILKEQKSKFLEDPTDKQDIPKRGSPVFQINDRVKKRFYLGGTPSKIRDPNPVGTVVTINGRWITVRHDEGEKGNLFATVPISFDYLANDLEHLNPLLKFATEF